VVDLALVESVPRFAALPSGTKTALAEAFEVVTVPAGERIINQGDFAYELFAILGGTALVEQDGDTPMRLLALFDQSFRRLCREHPEFADLVRGESRRLTHTATA
jgi:CRP-like cAMP-binding protein